MNLPIELEQEEDGRWIAEIDQLDGVLVYGATREEAIRNVKTLALRVVADRLENGESLPQQVESLIFEAARATGNLRRQKGFWQHSKRSVGESSGRKVRIRFWNGQTSRSTFLRFTMAMKLVQRCCQGSERKPA